MHKYDKVWNDINNLVALLRGIHVKQAIHEYYSKHGNTAPEELFEEYIAKVEEHLDLTPEIE